MRVAPFRIASFLLAWCAVSAAPGFAQVLADKEQNAKLLQLRKMATEVRELERCMALISVEDLSAFQPVVSAHYRKADELTKAIEDFVSRYAAKRGKQETVGSFKYRIWEASLRGGSEGARSPPTLNRVTCSELAH
jgi:hypothetical protein